MTVRETLFRMVDTGRVPHAIMFSEQDGGGAVALCVEFLEYLYCRNRTPEGPCGECPQCNRISKLIHSDVHFIFPTAAPQTSSAYLKEWRELLLSNPNFTEAQLGEALGIDGKQAYIHVAEAKELLSTLSLSSLEGGYRSVVIYLPEKLRAEAANRLLKLIEEPPLQTQFLFVTHAPEKVLQTIQSRCQRISVMSDKRSRPVEFSNPELLEDLMDALVRKDLLGALEVGEALAVCGSRENQKAFCRYASDLMRSLFMIQQGMPQLTEAGSKEAAWAKACRKTFPRLAVSALDRAHGLIERNVNQKVLFTDLVDRLYMII